jgi:hypothetical protein
MAMHLVHNPTGSNRGEVNGEKTFRQVHTPTPSKEEKPW